ncbi:MAG: redoxin domain-containing protein [Isosphaeraceae bacterium]
MPPISKWFRTVLFGCVPALTLAGQATAADQTKPPTPGTGSSLPVARLLNRQIHDFTLNDVTTGKPVSLYSYRGHVAMVLVFVGNDCPVGNLYAPRLVELAREFAPRKVAFIGINSNAHETTKEVAEAVKRQGLTFPVLKDEGNVVADELVAERTCEVVVLDGLARVRYRGAIDDQYGYGTRADAPTHHYLRDALTEIVTGGRVEVKGTPVVGCLINRVTPGKGQTRVGDAPRIRPVPPEVVESLADRDQAAEEAVKAVSYASDVAPIMQNRCQSCHRPGEVGPFPLLTYDDARKHSAMIREVVDNRRMPPWHADPRYGHFANDRSLSPKERAVLLAWVDQGTPLGDLAKAPAAKSFPEGWTIGTPDAVFEIPETEIIPAQGTVPYVHVRVPTRFKEDVWVRAAEARPGDRQAVHHIIVYVDDHKYLGGGRGGSDRRVDSHLCGYAPGDMPSVYPEGSAKLIPAGSDLVFQIHYTPTGTVRMDRSKVGLIFAKGPVKTRAHTLGIAQTRFVIPPGAGNHAVRSSHTFQKDVQLLSFMPHMHLRGKSFEYAATFPDGRREVLLSVPAYDFGWQSYYTLEKPLLLPKGTKIDCLAHFDNSSANPYKPDTSKPVRWGEQTWEEMMIGYVDFIDDAAPGEVRGGREAGRQRRLGVDCSGPSRGSRTRKPGDLVAARLLHWDRRAGLVFGPADCRGGAKMNRNRGPAGADRGPRVVSDTLHDAPGRGSPTSRRPGARAAASRRRSLRSNTSSEAGGDRGPRRQPHPGLARDARLGLEVRQGDARRPDARRVGRKGRPSRHSLPMTLHPAATRSRGQAWMGSRSRSPARSTRPAGN